MDEVRADRLIEKHSDNSLLVIIHEWPQKKKYKEKPELIPSLEYLVSVYACLLFKIVVKERLIVWDFLGNICLLSWKDYFTHFFFQFLPVALLLL